MDRNFNHTPGPWELLKPVGRTYYIASEVTGSDVALLNADWDPSLRDLEESEANARLIAAAPELLAVLVEMLGCPAMDPALFPCDEADAIIAKVRGT